MEHNSNKNTIQIKHNYNKNISTNHIKTQFHTIKLQLQTKTKNKHYISISRWNKTKILRQITIETQQKKYTSTTKEIKLLKHEK